ncbi:MAG: hypothetical protein M1823_005848 [Watsoniomyces obsoletus]|nr:MAG: hypothetical protein M1823_005848 [Watsoniomyces obsoletus]
MHNFHALEGHIVHRHFTPGYILLSYLVSCIGACTTLELLHRRTAGRGLYNWFLLVGSSVSMGGVAIWCMHFVGNRAIVLGEGQPEVQIAYNCGYTAISFFLPVLVLLPAFLATDTQDQVRRVRVALGGTLAGLAICGMHYLGQLGISNHDCIYQPLYVIGSAIVAIIASVAALTIFFLLRAAWTNSWWKRGLCALLLAGGVSGMHWVASVGTNYRLRVVDSSLATADELSKKQTVIVVIALSVAACLVLTILALFGERQRRTSAERVRRVVLAAAIFDPQGRLLVTPDGTLPSQKITGASPDPSTSEVFSVGHPIFHWAFRASRNWRAMTDLIPCMRHHLHDDTTPITTYQMTSGGTEAIPVDEADEQTIRYREMFCVAAADLAKQMGEPLDHLGTLYDEIVNTGTVEPSKSPMAGLLHASTAAAKAARRPSDLEAALPSLTPFGPGQLLFLVRRTDKTEADRLQSIGFRFTALSLIHETLAETLQVSPTEVMMHLEGMQHYATSTTERTLEAGVHLVCFALRATVGGTFDVLVRRNARNLLPSRPLGLAALDDSHVALLLRMTGWTVTDCLDWLRQQGWMVSNSEKDSSFAAQLGAALTGLANDLGEDMFKQARLVSEPVHAPCRGGNESYFGGRATLIALRLMVPIHARAPNPRRHVFLPLSFFKCQQYAYGPATAHEAFARQVHREFAPVVESTTQSTVVYRPPSEAVPRLIPTPRAATGQRRSWLGLTSLEKRWSHVCTPEPPKTAPESRPWGGILVSQEVNVNVDAMALTPVEGGSVEGDSTVVGMSMGSIGMASAEVTDGETFVDRLLTSYADGR